MTQDNVPFSEILKQLDKLCKQKATGTLSLTTSANRSAQVAIENGEVVFLFYSGKMGEAALAAMATIDSGRFRFQENSLPSRRMTLPATATLLARLKSGAATTSGNADVPSPSSNSAAISTGSAVTPAVSTAAPPRVASSLTAEQKQILERCLAEHIGPMAAIICEDQLRGTFNIEEALDALAAEVPTPAAAEQFRKMVLARLS
jgi:Domain of unknown function (DUF4388)